MTNETEGLSSVLAMCRNFIRTWKQKTNKQKNKHVHNNLKSFRVNQKKFFEFQWKIIPDSRIH